MNLVGYDAVTLGNHEFDYELVQLKHLVDLMNTKPDTCNFEKIGSTEQLFELYEMVSYGDIDIAYIVLIIGAGVCITYFLVRKNKKENKKLEEN